MLTETQETAQSEESQAISKDTEEGTAMEADRGLLLQQPLLSALRDRLCVRGAGRLTLLTGFGILDVRHRFCAQGPDGYSQLPGRRGERKELGCFPSLGRLSRLRR